MKMKEAAGDFAPRLHELHTVLDKTVCDAYNKQATRDSEG